MYKPTAKHGTATTQCDQSVCSRYCCAAVTPAMCGMGVSAHGPHATHTKHTKVPKKNKRRLDDWSEDNDVTVEIEAATLEHCDPAQVQPTFEGMSSRSKDVPKQRVLADMQD